MTLTLSRQRQTVSFLLNVLLCAEMNVMQVNWMDCFLSASTSWTIQIIHYYIRHISMWKSAFPYTVRMYNSSLGFWAKTRGFPAPYREPGALSVRIFWINVIMYYCCLQTSVGAHNILNEQVVLARIYNAAIKVSEWLSGTVWDTEETCQYWGQRGYLHGSYTW